MNDLIREFIDGLLADGWKSPVYPRFLHIVDEHRDLLPELARAVMDEVPAGGNFQGELVSYLPENDLSNLIEHALELLDLFHKSRCAL